MAVNLENMDGGRRRIQALLDLPKTLYIPNGKAVINPAQIGAVDMHWAAVTGPQSRFPALGTHSLLSCMGIAVHNPQTKATGLAHLAQDGASTDMAEESRLSLIAMLGKVAGQGGPIEVRMVGPNVGGYLAEAFVDHVAAHLKNYNATILSADFGHKGGISMIAADSRHWDRGMIRGTLSMSEIMTASAQGGQGAVNKLHEQFVDLRGMRGFAPDPHALLAYDGLSESERLAPAPEVQ